MMPKLNFKSILKPIFLLILLHFSNSSFSQEQEIKEQGSWIVKLNMTALADVFSFPTIQFAVEKKINNYFSVQTELGYQLYDFKSEQDTTAVKVGGFKINAEGRFYLFNYFKNDKTKKRNSDGVYFGIQTFYRENKYNTSVGYLKEGDLSGTGFVDSFGVIKKAYGANLALGYQKQFHQFIMEPYIYLGYMNRTIKNKNREFNTDLGDSEEGGCFAVFGSEDRAESSGSTGNFSFGFRVGYRF